MTYFPSASQFPTSEFSVKVHSGALTSEAYKDGHEPQSRSSICHTDWPPLALILRVVFGLTVFGLAGFAGSAPLKLNALQLLVNSNSTAARKDKGGSLDWKSETVSLDTSV